MCDSAREHEYVSVYGNNVFFGVSIEFNVDGPGSKSGISPFVLMRRFPSNVCFARFTLALIVIRFSSSGILAVSFATSILS